MGMINMIYPFNDASMKRISFIALTLIAILAGGGGIYLLGCFILDCLFDAIR